MRVVEHKPPEPVEIVAGDTYIFLEGPIQGADDWQAEAVNSLELSRPESTTTLHVLNPRRPEGTANWNDPAVRDRLYKEQVYWEQDDLAIPVEHGVHVCWFQPQNHELDYPPGREYAKTTKKELWMTLGVVAFAKQGLISLGIHPEFEAKDQLLHDRYLRTTLERHSIPIHETLDDTLEHALVLLGI